MPQCTTDRLCSDASGDANRQRNSWLHQSHGEAVSVRLLLTYLVVTSICSNCGHSARHENISSIRGTWHRCSRCNYAWRGLRQTAAALLRRPRRAEVAHADSQPLAKLPKGTRLSASGGRLPDQELSGDEHWLAGVEERFDAGGDLTADAPVASDMPARDPDPQVAPERQPARALTADTHDAERPNDSADPAEHWLAGVEAAYEDGCVSEQTPRATECEAPAESGSATVRRSDPEEVPASRNTRVEMDQWLDDMEEEVPLLGPADRRERQEKRTEAKRRPGIGHPDVLGDPALQDNRPAPAVAMADLVSQLGAMDADLVRVGYTFARCDAAFSRLVSRWHPGAAPVGPTAGGR